MRTPDELKAILTRDQLRLYRLIWERFVASQMAPAILDTVTVDLENGDVLISCKRFTSKICRIYETIY